MNKTTMKSLLICIILCVGFLAGFMSIPVVFAVGEEVVNGSFEIGDGYDGWTETGGTFINTTFAHSGSNSSVSQYSEGVYQDFSPEIQSNLTTSFTFWLARGAYSYPFTLECTWNTTNGGSISEYYSFDNTDVPSTYTWTEMNITTEFLTDAGDRWLEQISFFCGTGGFTTWFLDSVSIITEAPPAPSTYECNVVSSPELNVDWELDAAPYTTPWTDNITEGMRLVELVDLTVIADGGDNIYGFSRVLVTNSSGDFNFTDPDVYLDIQEEHNFTFFYENSFTINVTSTPYTTATFTATGYGYTAPKILTRDDDTHTFVCTLFETYVNASYKYTFDHWLVNGTDQYYSLDVDLDIAGDTNMTMVYLGSWIETPYIPSFTATAVNGTWYFRSDDHTIHEQLAYKLDFVNSYTSTYDSRTTTGTHDVSYGIRVWVLDIFGNLYELSSGTPEAIVTRSADAEGYQSAYFSCPAYSGLIDAVQVNVYQRFGSDPWSLRRYFITGEDLYIKLPESSWEIYYYTNRTVASTTGYFFHGSSSYSSRINFQYYRANPWEIAMARLQAGNYFGFLFTPWTYYLGDIFWTLLLLFGIVTAYNRFGSLKPILALLWLFGGVGSFLSAMIPAIALSVAWLMLALAMGITLFKLIYR
jgi:hypothetical protein